MNYPQNFNQDCENSVLPDNEYPSYTLLADNRQGFGFPTTTMHEPRDTALSEVWNSNNTVTPRGSPRGIAGFVAKLYQCLQSPQNEPKYARWCKHQGRDMFIIERIPEFTEAVLPRLFKHRKFPSFVRQLNIYGFQRDTDARKSKDNKDKDSCRWYHPYFKPGRRDLFHHIRRKAARYSRKKKGKGCDDPETILSMNEEDDDDEDMAMENNIRRQRTLSLKEADENSYVRGRRNESLSSSHSSLQHVYPIGPMTNTIETPILNINPKNEPHEEQLDSSEPEKYPLSLYSDRQNYEKIHNFYTEKLSAAHQKIKEQRLQIQRLEAIISKNKPQEDYMNVIYQNQPYYNSNHIYPQASNFPFRNPNITSSREDLSQNWIPGYADSMRSTIRDHST